MATIQERMQKGEETMEELSGGTRKAAGLPQYEVAPDMGQWVTASLFGDVWGRPDLPKKIRSFASMSVLTVTGKEAQLRGHVNFALNIGWSKEEISELFFHLVLYGGLPSALNALGVAREVFKDRGLLDQPMEPTEGTEATSEERYAKGIKVMAEMSATDATEFSMGDDVAMVHGMEDHIITSLFGDVWSRDVLPKKIRSIATMSALTALGKEPQLEAHVNWGLNVGWSKEEISELFFHLAFYCGLPAALNGLRVARGVFKERGLVS